MKPKELTPEEIIEKLSNKNFSLFGKKCKSIEGLKTPKFTGYSKTFSKDKVLCYGIIFVIPRHTRLNAHFSYVYKKIIKKQILDLLVKKFGIRLADDGLGIDTIMVDMPNEKPIHLGMTDPCGFTFTREDIYFSRSKELAIELLKLYLDAHKDCCTW